MNTHITFYRSNLCPRCHLARKYLQQLASADSSLRIEEVDALLSPRQAWQDGIRMIPAVKIGDQILSGLYLSRDDIAAFIARQRP
ncbi:MAG: Glutaredoxin 2 [uncultured bacterium]|nr:MAG: Glutaredoxin 2 [uncultured bacterium]